MIHAAVRKSRNVGSFLRKELPERAEDRSEKNMRKDLMLLSSVAFGATPPSYGRGLWHFAMHHR